MAVIDDRIALILMWILSDILPFGFIRLTSLIQLKAFNCIMQIGQVSDIRNIL